MPRKKANQGAVAASGTRSEGTFGIDPALEHVKHDGAASAERSTANMVAPVANMGGAGTMQKDQEDTQQDQEDGVAPLKKKRGRKSNRERQEPQQQEQQQRVQDHVVLQTDDADPAPEMLTQLAAAAVADEEQQQLVQQQQQFAQLRAALTAEVTDSTPKKRKHQDVDQDEQAAEGDNAGKKKKKKTQFAKRTDGASARSASPEEDESKSFPESGTFTQAELKALDRFMETWKEEHGLSHASLAEMVQSKHRGVDESEGGFWAQVFEVLPRRKDRRSVRLTCRRRYHNFERRGKWEAEDDEMLKEAWNKNPNKWTTIGEQIHRMPEDCKDRYQNYLACGDSRRTGDWTEKEEMALAMAVEECKQAARKAAKEHAARMNQPFRDDKDWMSMISFKTVSAKMGFSRSGLQCRQHWKRMQTKEARRANSLSDKKKKTWRDTQAADNYKRMLAGDKYEILQMILRTETSTEDNIPWKLMTRDNSESKWTTKDRKVAFEQMKKLVPPQPTLTDELNSLIDYFQARHGHELNHYYTGPVRSQDAPRKAYTRPVDAEETPAARIRKGQRSKGSHQIAQNNAAVGDDQDDGDADVAIDPALENVDARFTALNEHESPTAAAAAAAAVALHKGSSGAVPSSSASRKRTKAKTGTDVLLNAKAGRSKKGPNKKSSAAPPVEMSGASWFALPGDTD